MWSKPRQASNLVQGKTLRPIPEKKGVHLMSNVIAMADCEHIRIPVTGHVHGHKGAAGIARYDEGIFKIKGFAVAPENIGGKLPGKLCRISRNQQSQITVLIEVCCGYQKTRSRARLAGERFACSNSSYNSGRW